MKNLVQKSRLALLALVGALGASACAPPPVMIVNQPLGDRVVRFAMQRNVPGAAIVGGLGGGANQGTFNLLIQACTLDPNGQPTGCRGAMVVDNVAPGTLY
ncbi:MAG: hypothetical protein Q8Q09_21955 [Deltaproteobacteria bacterium]|nr:hypothetical protein [Deltaproteobacteria bacterium]